MSQSPTLTKVELTSKVAEKTGLTVVKTQEVLHALLDQMQAALAEGRKVELRNFGIFRVKRRAERVGRNPSDANAGTFMIPAKNVVKFKTGFDLDKAVNQETVAS